ncbi:membrane magnesium transporter 1, partial [Tremellales sp. Uapishka_1]
MSKLLGQVLVGISVLAIAHAAFSTYECTVFSTYAEYDSCSKLTLCPTDLSTLKALARPSSSLPYSIIIEAVLALLLFLPGTALATPALEDVTYRGEMAKRTLEDHDARIGFMTFSARGRSLFGDQTGRVVEK